ncbi:hypothetical protein N39L_49940 [Limnospira platensis NIES-39]|jgi:hypothetical protein|nr:hypothetical protein AP285_22910 [Arthrospira platensis YZ]KDR55942.1 hypothetical protein APPUASWS_019690 [Arthrospira platensis str. Paraca]BDT15271.1 hypothetical protein N39L_49940 [Arthrospira platensis NIES-39]
MTVRRARANVLEVRLEAGLVCVIFGLRRVRDYHKTLPPRALAGGEGFILNCWHYGQVGDEIKDKVTSQPAPLQVKLISISGIDSHIFAGRSVNRIASPKRMLTKNN